MEIIETEYPTEEAGQALTEALKTHTKQPILLMLSGGSAFSILEYVSSDVLGSHITLTVLDERYSTDPTINNYAQLQQTTFFAACVEHGVETIPMTVQEGESLTEMSARFEKTLRTWRKQNPSGVVIATMGVGHDGHTAGIFWSEHGISFDDDKWVVGYVVPKEVNTYQERVTVTNTYLRTEIAQAIVYAVGEEKYNIVQNIYSHNAEFRVPANIFREIKDLTIYTTANSTSN